MPPKTTFSEEAVVQAAFELAREEGAANLSARKVARKLGTSTAPVYSSFASMDDLKLRVFQEAKNLLFTYVTKHYTDLPFLNMGVGLVMFSSQERQLFRTLFLTDTDSRSVVDEFVEELKQQLAIYPIFDQLPKQRRDEILTRMWIFTHGLASLICVGHMETMTAKEAADFLYDIGRTMGQKESRD